MRVITPGRRLFILLLAAGLGACGFRLAGSSSLPQELAQIQLLSGDLSEKQSEALRSRLRQAGAEISLQPAEQAVQLRVRLKILPDRRLVTSAGSGKIVDRVSRGLDYSLRKANGDMLVQNRSLLQQKDIVLDDNNLLSSTVERENVVEDLEAGLFDQLIRQLKRL